MVLGGLRVDVHFFPLAWWGHGYGFVLEVLGYMNKSNLSINGHGACSVSEASHKGDALGK